MKKEKKEKTEDKYVKFAYGMKALVMEAGRTNFINKNEVIQLIKLYGI